MNWTFFGYSFGAECDVTVRPLPHNSSNFIRRKFIINSTKGMRKFCKQQSQEFSIIISIFTFVLLHNHEIGSKNEGYNVYKCEIILIVFSELLNFNAPFCNIFDMGCMKTYNYSL